MGVKSFVWGVRTLALIALVTGLVDVVVGAKGQSLIGVVLTDGFGDPVLNSQIRYLGAIWFGFGVLLWMCSNNLARYNTLLRGALWVVVLGGIGRTISLIQFGFPSSAAGCAFVVGAIAIELLAVPFMLFWGKRLVS